MRSFLCVISLFLPVVVFAQSASIDISGQLNSRFSRKHIYFMADHTDSAAIDTNGQFSCRIHIKSPQLVLFWTDDSRMFGFWGTGGRLTMEIEEYLPEKHTSDNKPLLKILSLRGPQETNTWYAIFKADQQQRQQHNFFSRNGRDSIGRAIYPLVSAFVKKHPASALSPFLLNNSPIPYPLKQPLVALLKKNPHKDEVKSLHAQLGREQLAYYRKKMPNFRLPDSSGNTIELYNIHQPYILLHFWGAFCGPCRLENPYVRELYASRRAKGLELIGISLDESREDWTMAIRRDSLNFPNVSDLKGFQSTIARQASLEYVPSNILLDSNYHIIAVDAMVQEMALYLDKPELLNRKRSSLALAPKQALQQNRLQ